MDTRARYGGAGAREDEQVGSPAGEPCTEQRARCRARSYMRVSESVATLAHSRAEERLR